MGLEVLLPSKKTQQAIKSPLDGVYSALFYGTAFACARGFQNVHFLD